MPNLTKNKTVLNFLNFILQIYGKLDSVSTEHKEVVSFKIALPRGKLQTNNVMTQNERSVACLGL